MTAAITPDERHRLIHGPFYALLLGPTLVLAAYGTTHVSPNHLIRPLFVSLIVGAVLLVAFGGLTRRWHGAGVAVALILVTIIASGPLIGALVIAWLFLSLRAAIWHKPERPSELMTRPLNVLVGLWFVLASATAAVVSLPPAMPEAEPVTVEPGPNVYLLLLDAYPRHDSLMEYFGFDNRPFLDALGARGFDVAEHGRTEYKGTIQVVPTMFHMRPVEELLNHEAWSELNTSDAHHRRLWHMLNGAPIHDAFEAAGYTTISIPSSAEDLDWRSADIVLESAWLTRFEDYLIGRGPLGLILPFAAMDRAELLDSFRHLEESAGTSPRFVFAHLMAPHDPYVFTADGSPAAKCGSACTNHAGPPNPMLADRFLGHLHWTNARVLAAMDRIIAVDPDATVIVFSDHGLRRDLADLDEWHRTLFAARGASFPEDASPLDIFGDILERRSVTRSGAPSRR